MVKPAEKDLFLSAGVLLLVSRDLSVYFKNTEFAHFSPIL